MTYHPADNRYDRMIYRRTGRSGLMLPAISLGLWHNFGHDTPHDTIAPFAMRRLITASRISILPTITAPPQAAQNRPLARF